MGWKKWRRKFKKRVKKFGKVAIPIVGAVGGLVGLGVVATLANKYAEKRAGLPDEEEALAVQGPGLPTSAATAQAARTQTESFPFNIPGIGSVLKSLFG